MIRIFPVQGGASFPNDFSFETTANLRKHLGNDLLAPMGTPLLAVDNGTIRLGTDPLGGNIANLYADDGTRYYYAHLSRFEGSSNRRVRTGEVIGYVGMTGNAQGTVPHTHFEVHPGNGPAINPFSELQSALARSRAIPSSPTRSPWLGPLVGIGIATAGIWALFNYAPARQTTFQRRRV